MKRVFIIVLDSFGIGELPDAGKYGDEGSNTLKAVASSPCFYVPTMRSLGLFNIENVSFSGDKADFPIGNYARLAEKSTGKDTTSGHWEIAGIISEKPMPTFPHGFPESLIEKFSKLTGRKILCNKPYSGTEVIKDYGEQAIREGSLIVYTSADSVFQIAAHEDVIPVKELYGYCEIARSLLTGEFAVGRVIARPFEGSYPFKRTSRRHDYSLPPFAPTMCDLIEKKGLSVISIGKINDIFAGKGITESHPTVGNDDGMQKTAEAAKRDFEGLCFTNLVDFDAVYGHRNDVDGYAKALTAFDENLKSFLPLLRQNDLLIITADHGCDPSTPSTDHSREYVPALFYGNNFKSGVNLGTRSTFADISATVLDYLNIDKEATAGESLLKYIIR